jgi:hypothetical protein
VDGDTIVEPNHVIVDGMLGQVFDDPYAGLICTPGISTFILMLGRDKPYGYGDDWFVPMDSEPGPDEIQRSLELYANADVIFAERNGYYGFVLIGRKLVYVRKLFMEIRSNVARIRECHLAGINPVDVKGHLKRLRKVLLAFHKHPLADEAVQLAGVISFLGIPDSDTPQVLDQVLHWLEKAVVMQKEREAQGIY